MKFSSSYNSHLLDSITLRYHTFLVRCFVHNIFKMFKACFAFPAVKWSVLAQAVSEMSLVLCCQTHDSLL